MLGWSHQLVKAVVQERYNPALPTSAEINSYQLGTEENVIDLLAQYFGNKWVDLAKPFLYSQRQMKRAGLQQPQAEADRFMPKQSTVCFNLTKGGAALMTFNHRKMSVLLDTYLSLIRSNMDNALEVLQDFTKYVIFDYEMLYALLKSKRFADLIQVQELCAIAIPPQCEQELMRRELFLFSEYLIQDIEYLKQNPDCFE